MNKRSNKIHYMPNPSKKRKGPQLNRYFQILDFPLHIVGKRKSTSQENQDTRQNTSSGGRRSTDADYIDLIDGWYSLSPRERDVTRLTCEGCTNDQIAYKLGITSGTAKTYHQRIFLKMKVRSKIDLRMKFFGFDFSRYLSDQ